MGQWQSFVGAHSKVYPTCTDWWVASPLNPTHSSKFNAWGCGVFVGKSGVKIGGVPSLSHLLPVASELWLGFRWKRYIETCLNLPLTWACADNVVTHCKTSSKRTLKPLRKMRWLFKNGGDGVTDYQCIPQHSLVNRLSTVTATRSLFTCVLQTVSFLQAIWANIKLPDHFYRLQNHGCPWHVSAGKVNAAGREELPVISSFRGDITGLLWLGKKLINLCLNSFNGVQKWH